MQRAGSGRAKGPEWFYGPLDPNTIFIFAFLYSFGAPMADTTLPACPGTPTCVLTFGVATFPAQVQPKPGGRFRMPLPVNFPSLMHSTLSSLRQEVPVETLLLAHGGEQPVEVCAYALV